MSNELFLDTNLLIYWLDEGVPEKQQKAWRPVAESLTSASSCISYQVVQEAVNTLIWEYGVVTDRVRRFLDEVLIPLWQAHSTSSLYDGALSLQNRRGFSFHDSLIVAAALEAGRARL
jgi:predicted nucleic acid-binding protein